MVLCLCDAGQSIYAILYIVKIAEKIAMQLTIAARTKVTDRNRCATVIMGEIQDSFNIV